MATNQNQNYLNDISHNLAGVGYYENKFTELQGKSNEITQTTNTNMHSYDNNQNINYRFTGPNVVGYRELPNVYDGYAYDLNQLQITQNTIYITGLILCSSLLIVGVMIGSSRE
jgi:hypothetical protein